MYVDAEMTYNMYKKVIYFEKYKYHKVNLINYIQGENNYPDDLITETEKTNNYICEHNVKH